MAPAIVMLLVDDETASGPQDARSDVQFESIVPRPYCGQTKHCAARHGRIEDQWLVAQSRGAEFDAVPTCVEDAERSFAFKVSTSSWTNMATHVALPKMAEETIIIATAACQQFLTYNTDSVDVVFPVSRSQI